MYKWRSQSEDVMNVLLVDDDPVILRMITSILQSQGFQVIGVSTGIDALAVSKIHPIDVLVTDVEMTDMDGLSLAELLVKLYPDLPVLFISGYPINNLETKRQRSLLKPFNIMDLINTISDLVGKAVHAEHSGKVCAVVSG